MNLAAQISQPEDPNELQFTESLSADGDHSGDSQATSPDVNSQQPGAVPSVAGLHFQPKHFESAIWAVKILSKLLTRWETLPAGYRTSTLRATGNALIPESNLRLQDDEMNREPDWEREYETLAHVVRDLLLFLNRLTLFKADERYKLLTTTETRDSHRCNWAQAILEVEKLNKMLFDELEE